MGGGSQGCQSCVFKIAVASLIRAVRNLGNGLELMDRGAGQRQVDLEGHAAATGLLHVHLSAMSADHCADDGESEPPAAAVAAAARVPPGKPVRTSVPLPRPQPPPPVP